MNGRKLREQNEEREQMLREAIELLFFGYRSFTKGPDVILAKYGLGRVHHRILYFVGRDPGLSVADLLLTLGISKQALNAPLRRLIESDHVRSRTGSTDRRVRELSLTAAGRKLEARLSGTQLNQLREVFDAVGPRAESGWRKVMQQMAAESNGMVSHVEK